MRVLAACLVGFLGLGALATMAACSDTTDMGSAGTGGASGGSAAGSGGKASSAGSTSSAGSSDAAGASNECGFATEACAACLSDNCDDETTACGADTGCRDDLVALPNCTCNPANNPDTCIGAFVTANGALGEKLANCYTANHCDDVCQ
jgi:hypothetical protein